METILSPHPSGEAQEIPLLENEAWWGGLAQDGVQMPYGPVSAKTWSRNPSDGLAYNQGAPLLVSSRGRYVWHDSPFGFEFTKEDSLRLTFPQGSGDAHEYIIEAGSSLRDAFQSAARAHFPANHKHPTIDLFSKPQYNTWMELQYGHSQDGILAYAEAVIANGFPPGVLMIDDTWQEDYGIWKFHPGRFPDPKNMIGRLRELGFDVVVWICPFVSADSKVFRDLHLRHLLVRTESEEPAIRKWWNGHSAVLDGSHPEAFAWLRQQLCPLVEELGVAGFKFDAGDPEYYRIDDRTHLPINPHGQCEAWARFGQSYSLNEYRSCWKCAGLPLVQRLSDKSHSWGNNGLASLLPNALAQGLLGYAFICPDMIGGGLQPEFEDSAKSPIDQELFVRWAQCSALFPMMQFSLAPWRVLDAQHAELCRQAALLHLRYAPEIETLARHAAMTGEPLLRHLAYEFPGENFELINDQFMLGSDILVAPVLEKHATKRTVRFPSGRWQRESDSSVNNDIQTYQGPGDCEVSAPLESLPRFRRLDK